MPSCGLALALASTFLFLALPLRGQAPSDSFSPHSGGTPENKDPLVILEIGAASSWNVMGGSTTFAPNFAVETTPIDNWLELEAGVSPFFTGSSTEWDADLLFKKP